MTGNSADISVEGPNASAVAKNVVSTLGVAAEDVEDVNVTFSFDSGDETTVTIDGDGAVAGVIAQQMIGGIDWDAHTATGIDASLGEAEGADSGESDANGDDESDADEDDAEAFQPHVSPLGGGVDPDTVQFPQTPPGRLSEDTHVHAAGQLLREHRDVLNKGWATLGGLADFAGEDLTESQLRSALSRLFRRRGLVVRRKDDTADALAYEYHPTTQLVEELHRLGEYDAEELG